MHPTKLNERKEELVREVQEMEDVYAEAFAEEVDARSLANLWEHIKELRREADETERGRGRQ